MLEGSPEQACAKGVPTAGEQLLNTAPSCHRSGLPARFPRASLDPCASAPGGMNQIQGQVVDSAPESYRTQHGLRNSHICLLQWILPQRNTSMHNSPTPVHKDMLPVCKTPRAPDPSLLNSLAWQTAAPTSVPRMGEHREVLDLWPDTS